MRALVEAILFSSSQTHLWARRNLATQWSVCMKVCMCVCRFFTCVRNLFHFPTLFSVLNGAFFFFFSLVVGTIETISRRGPVYCFCFSLPVSLEPSAFSTVVSGGGRHCSFLLGLAERLEGQLEMKLLLSAICLTL